MKAEIRDGDEKKSQYVVLTAETEKETAFLTDLREFWKDRDYCADLTVPPDGPKNYPFRFDTSQTRTQRRAFKK